MSENSNPAAAPARSQRTFHEVVASLRGGLVDDELTAKLKEVVASCRRTGGKGKVSISIEVEPHGADNREMYLRAKIDSKMPSNPDLSEPSIRFHTTDGALVMDDPNQRQLDLDQRRAAREADELRRFAAGVGA